jgi:hypothetical protein
VSQVKVSKRLNNTPAVIVSPFPSSMKAYFQLLDQTQLENFKNNHTMEINPNHKLIIGLNNLRKVDSKYASTLTKQLLDNTLLSCGLLIDPTDFVTRINKLMEGSIDTALTGRSLGSDKSQSTQSQPGSSSSTSSSTTQSTTGSQKVQSSPRDADKEAILREAYEKLKKNSSVNVGNQDGGADSKPNQK